MTDGDNSEWNDLEERILWIEGNRGHLTDKMLDGYVMDNVFATMDTYRAVAATVTAKPGAAAAMKERRGTPAPTGW